MKPNTICYRAFEFRAEAGEGDGRTLEGYAAVFDQLTDIDSWEGAFQEQIKRGAFTKTLKERTPVLQFDHGRDARTGTVPIGAFRTLEEREKGLWVSADLFDNDVVEPVRQAIAGGAIDGMSFRFKVVREAWFDNADKPVPASELSDLLWKPGSRGPLRRDLQELQLFELGPVVFPAYEGTTVGVRSLLANLDPDDRAKLIRELAAELRLAVPMSPPSGAASGTSDDDSDAAATGTSEDTPDAARTTGTSGLTCGARSEALRELDLKEAS